MLSKIKKQLFSGLVKARSILSGTGISRIPGVWRVYSSLLQHTLSNKDIIEVHGNKMYVNLRDKSPAMRAAFRDYATFTGHEEFTTEMFKSAVKEGDIVVDLGANIGYYTLLAAKLVGSKGKVYAFEPEPRNYDLLLRNIELNGYENIVPVQKAVSNAAGIVRFYLSDKDIGAHTLRKHRSDKRYFNQNSFGKFIEVESISLDEFFKDEQHQIDVIKMDIEGAEMLALAGMDRVIRNSKNLKMCMEFYPSAITDMGHSPEELARKLLDDYHFSMLAIYDSYKEEKPCVKINSADELMNLCKDNEKIFNLFLEKGD